MQDEAPLPLMEPVAQGRQAAEEELPVIDEYIHYINELWFLKKNYDTIFW